MNATKKILIILFCVIILGLILYLFLYATAASTVISIMNAANVQGIEVNTSDSPIISAENLEKLSYTKINKKANDLFVNGGITPPLGLLSLDNITLHFSYNYQVVNVNTGKEERIFSGGPVYIKLKLKNLRWVVIDIVN